VQNIVHIGMHKTGSTYLQALLWKNRSVFRDMGADILDFGGTAKQTARKMFDLLADDQGRVAQRALISPPDLSWRIVSSENLYQTTSEMIERLHNYLGEARVICFLRNPCDHIVSRYKQLVRTKGLEIDFEGFVAIETLHMTEREQLSKRQKIAYYAYDKRIASWKDVFPDTNIASYPSDNIFDSFMNLAGLPPVSLARLPNEAQSANKSISAETATLLVRLSGLLELQHEARRFVAANDTLCREAFAADFRYVCIDLSDFFEAFMRHSPVAMEQHRFRPISVEAWPHHIALTDEMIVKRIDELRRAISGLGSAQGDPFLQC
jgi:hypothetical protein